MDWTQVYLQNLNQMNQMLNQMNQNQNFNNAMDQINFMGNNNSPQMVGGGRNFDKAQNDLNAFNKKKYKINLIFTTLRGVKINMFFDCDETIENVITKFLKRVGLERLIGNLHNELKFILAAEHIDYGEKRKLKDVIMGGSTTSNVVVHDTKNIVGA
jgi:hypothetical protein